MDRIPIFKVGDLLLVTIQVDMHDRLALELQDDLTRRIVETGAKGVLIDISALEMVDSFIGRMIANIAAMSRILDAETVVVGMQPEVAITLVELGLSLPGVRTALDAEAGMALLRSRWRSGGHGLSHARAGATNCRIRTSEDVVRVRQRSAAGRSSGASAWSTRPSSSRRRASWRATRSTTAAAARSTIECVDGADRIGIRLIFEDDGPGIPDIDPGAPGRLHDGGRAWAWVSAEPGAW